MKESSTVFEYFATEIRRAERHRRIEEWNRFRLDFSVPFERKSEVYQHIKHSFSNDLCAAGLYAIFSGKKCLYIGKGRPIWKRIKDHYRASKGHDKAIRWVDFFSRYQLSLTVYWLPFAPFSDEESNDQLRGLFEYLLQTEYRPIFDEPKTGKFYSAR